MPSPERLMRVIEIQTEIVKLGLDLGGVMQFIVEQTLPLVQADGAAIELAENGMMVYRATSGLAQHQLGLRLHIEGSLSGLGVRTGDTLSCVDSETDPRVDRSACRTMGLRSMIIMPLKHRGHTVGVLKAMSRQAGKFSDNDTMVLGLMSEIVAATMYFSAKYDSDQLFIKATHDDLTGLANRALFMDRLKNVVRHADRAEGTQVRSSIVMMVDMDGLKTTNDTHGHRVGDAVITAFAHRLKGAVRQTDTVARMGGDDFGIILHLLHDADAISSAIERIDTALEQPFSFENRSYPLKASMGMARIPQDSVKPEQLLDMADQRMYAVKQARKKWATGPSLHPERP